MIAANSQEQVGLALACAVLLFLAYHILSWYKLPQKNHSLLPPLFFIYGGCSYFIYH